MNLRQILFPKHQTLRISQPVFPALRCLGLLALLLLVACSGGPRLTRPLPPPDDQRPVPPPRAREINLAADNVSKLGTLQIQRFFDISRHFRALFGRPKQAMNIDAFDAVYNSSWFTNRNGLRATTLEEIARGPDQGEGPDTSGTWTIVRAKAQGVTPGFTIKDPRGVLYVVKFDPAGYPEMSTGAEVVSTKLFHAAGYNVPENYLVRFHPRILRLGEAVKLTDKKGEQRFMNEADLEEILGRIQTMPDGRIRAVASKYLPGKPLGSFYYQDVREDDPNDVIPHQHRRELRGLRVIAAWLNHYDTKANNTLDMYDPAGYVRHYLIDFGSTLGSQGDEPMPPEIGREGIADPPQVLKTIGSLGIYIRPWERPVEFRYPSIGYFIAEDFQPQQYKFILPNPAFMNLTPRDGYWGAKVVMSFSDEQIGVAVSQGRYSNPEAAAYLRQVLIERRDAVGRYWFERMPSLDNFRIQETAGGAVLSFQDLAVQTGLVPAGETDYRYELRYQGRLLFTRKELGKNTAISVAEWPGVGPAEPPSSGEPLWTVSLQLRRGNTDSWSKAVHVFLQQESSTAFSVVGVEREE